MIFIDKPKYFNKVLTVRQVINACLPKNDYAEDDYEHYSPKTVKSDMRKKRIQSYADEISRMEQEYDRKASNASLCELPKTIDRKCPTYNQSFKADLVDYLYEERFRRDSRNEEEKSTSLPEEYRMAIQSQASGICPYCGKSEDTSSFQLDHFLPKSEFPVFAVTPVNLVPCCPECNNKKHERIPYRKISVDNAHSIANYRYEYVQLPHPYYDDFGNEVWIRARLIEVRLDKENPTYSFEFYTDRPVKWSDSEYDERYTRCIYHFSFFDLKKRFGGKNSGNIIQAIRKEAKSVCVESTDYNAFYEHVKLCLLNPFNSTLGSGAPCGWRKVCINALFDENNDACESFWKTIWKKNHPA